MIDISLKGGLKYRAIMMFFVAKKGGYWNWSWPEPRDIAFPGRFGISSIDVTKGSFCLGLPKTDGDVLGSSLRLTFEADSEKREDWLKLKLAGVDRKRNSGD